MSSRMNKYYENEEVVNTRVHKNEELYREISKNELDSFEVKSNTTILGENKNEIDVEKIKKILDTKYNEVPKRKSIRLEEEPIEEEEKEITKEYDINVVLEKAREQKTDNYEEERLKKLHDTQFDILKNLQVEKTKTPENLDDEEEDNSTNDASENLQSLINTIALNEKNSQNEDLDLLSDLKGSGNTEVLEGLKEKVEEEEEKTEIKEVNNDDTKMINSFYTSSNALKDKDFEDIDDDFSKSIEQDNIGIKIFIAIIAIIFIIGLGFLIKTLFFS